MTKLIKINRGLDIIIEGAAKKTVGSAAISEIISIVPDHYHGITPKIAVKPGDRVCAGSTVFYSKADESVKFVSPVSGEVIAVNRGERRKVLSIDIKRDSKIEFKKFEFAPLSSLSGAEVKELLLESGLWAYIKQRPYDVIAETGKNPKAIFISAFHSAPLAPDADFLLEGQYADFQAGINALAKLTDGKVHLGIDAKSKSAELRALKTAEITEYSGAHPAGNVSVHINRTAPVNKGETVFCCGVQEVLYIGRFFNRGVVDLHHLVALTGPEVIQAQYYNTLPGSNIQTIIKGTVYSEIPLRYISGDVLSGTQADENQAIDPYTAQITAVKEGIDTHEFAGWAMPRFKKFSSTNLFPAKLLVNPLVKAILGAPKFEWDTRLLGGKRAIIMSGEYDRFFPFDIYPEQLIKAMIAKNIEKMENLGAYEIAPEDFAVCEFADTSKLPLQSIVRDALDYLKQEVE
jgi:Na+-transporting NADH:ubiquinone oxidoreductase subunit A